MHNSSFSDYKLPENLVDFRSPESKIRLVRCLTNGTGNPYLSLSSCYETQSKTSYCGLTTLTMALNALQIDASQLRKTRRRWYTAELLDTCRPLKLVDEIGITMEVFQCLASQNGTDCVLTRPSDDYKDYEQFRKDVCISCVSGSTDEKKFYTTEIIDGSPEYDGQRKILAVAYDRYSMDMQGLAPEMGHFSPVGAYDKETDSVLILDVARYKYPPHWVPVELLFKAMLPLDPETGKSRGYFTLSKRKANENRSISQGCLCGNTARPATNSAKIH